MRTVLKSLFFSLSLIILLSRFVVAQIDESAVSSSHEVFIGLFEQLQNKNEFLVTEDNIQSPEVNKLGNSQVGLLRKLGLRPKDKILSLAWTRTLDLTNLPGVNSDLLLIKLQRNGVVEKLEKKINVLRQNSLGEDPSSQLIPRGAAELRVPVSLSTLKQWTSDLPKLLTQARMVPYFRYGRSIGLRFFAIQEGGAFQQLGFQDGDVMLKVGEEEIEPQHALKLFRHITEQKDSKVEIERNGYRIIIKYDVK